MSSGSVPIDVVIDLSALLSSRTQAWEDYDKVGTCYVPEVVSDEIEFLTGRAPEPEQEEVAREFSRFFPNSGWIISSVQAQHPNLQPAAGAAQSKQARLTLAVAECVYGMSQKESTHLVVLVTNHQLLGQRIQKLNLPNLCAVPAAGYLQWCRTGKQPPIVTSKLEGLQELVPPPAPVRSRPVSQPPSAMRSRPISQPPSAMRSRPVSRPPVASGSSRDREASFSQRRNRSTPDPDIPQVPRLNLHQRHKPSLVSTVFSGFVSFLALVVALTALGLGWKTVHPKSFNPFWQKTVAPLLPKELKQLPK